MTVFEIGFGVSEFATSKKGLEPGPFESNAVTGREWPSLVTSIARETDAGRWIYELAQPQHRRVAAQTQSNVLLLFRESHL
jgi:hypothetical protein